MEERIKERAEWSPYIAGGLAGILIVLSVWITGKYIGASTTFVRATGFIEKFFQQQDCANF